MLAIWRKDDVRPRFAAVAAAIGIAGLAAFAFSFTPLPENHRAGLISTAIVPEGEAPKNTNEWRARSVALIAKYPRDPRPRYFRAIDLIDRNDMAGAERELRTGLAEVELWRKAINPEFELHMKAALAVVMARRPAAGSARNRQAGLRLGQDRRHPRMAGREQAVRELRWHKPRYQDL